ncbi:glycosyltransferase family 1 protein [Novosphingobium sp. 18052]|uniref:glycosyltransferase family 4 protein n=2 Tax=unclassified Novosphingobium TaxID=2644732 RepID=UPI00135CF6F4|nr:glycosyltransferase family 1 protein [Novosphingobium sp. 18052]
MSQGDDSILVNARFLMQPVTGVQRVARELVSEMDRMVGAGETALRIALACEPDAEVSALGLRHIEVERRGGASGHLWEQLVLPRMVAGRRLLCLGNTAPLISALAGQRVAVMIHDVSYLSLPQAYSLRYRLAHRALLPVLLRRADPILTVSVTERERLKHLNGRAGKRIVAVQNGAWSHDRVERGAPGGQDGEREPMVLYVGSLSRRKNVERVIAVAQRLAREDGVRTVLVGASNEILAPIRASVAPDVAHMLEFVGQVPCLEALAGYYRRASCLLFPSLYEASPLPPVEAMSLGCPVVASAIPSMTERCGTAALYCDPLDSEDILAAVRRVLGDPALAESLRIQGFARAESFSWREQARRILEVMTAS